MEERKHNIAISQRLYGELKDYCELNNLKINEFAEKLLSSGLAVEKYGDAPFIEVLPADWSGECTSPVVFLEADDEYFGPDSTPLVSTPATTEPVEIEAKPKEPATKNKTTKRRL